MNSCLISTTLVFGKAQENYRIPSGVDDNVEIDSLQLGHPSSLTGSHVLTQSLDSDTREGHNDASFERYTVEQSSFHGSFFECFEIEASEYKILLFIRRGMAACSNFPWSKKKKCFTQSKKNQCVHIPAHSSERLAIAVEMTCKYHPHFSITNYQTRGTNDQVNSPPSILVTLNEKLLGLCRAPNSVICRRALFNRSKWIPQHAMGKNEATFGEGRKTGKLVFIAVWFRPSPLRPRASQNGHKENKAKVVLIGKGCIIYFLLGKVH